MVAFSSFRFFESGALPKRAPATFNARTTPHLITDVAEIAARIRAAVAEAALFLWTVLVLGFLLLVLVSCVL
jgi:hypothetical protein